LKKWRGQRQGRKEKFHHRVSRGAAEDAEKRRNGQRFNTEGTEKRNPRPTRKIGAWGTEHRETHREEKPKNTAPSKFR